MTTLDLPCRHRSREEIGPGRWGCASTKVLVANSGVTLEWCATCHCRDHEPEIGETESPHPPAAEPVYVPCRHELPIVSWAPCDCDWKHLRGCELHDLCTRAPNNGTQQACQRCPDYAA